MDPDQSYYFGSLRIRIRNTDSKNVIHDMCPVLFYRVLRYRGVVCEGGLPRLHGLVQCQVSSELGMRHIFGWPTRHTSKRHSDTFFPAFKVGLPCQFCALCR